MTLCHWDSFNCNPFICVASLTYRDARRHFDMGGGSLRDPPWVPLESTNIRVLCSYGGGLIPLTPSFRTLDSRQPRGGFRGGEGAAAPLFQGTNFCRHFCSSGVSTNSELAKFRCSQTVKSNILLSQNAGNAISETLNVQIFPEGACPRTPLAGLGLRPRTTATRSTAPPLSKILDPSLQPMEYS